MSAFDWQNHAGDWEPDTEHLRTARTNLERMSRAQRQGDREMAATAAQVAAAAQLSVDIRALTRMLFSKPQPQQLNEWQISSALANGLHQGLARHQLDGWPAFRARQRARIKRALSAAADAL